MYDKLIKRLRDAAKMSDALAVLLPHSEGGATEKLYNEAADAIEELKKVLDAVNDAHNDGYDVGYWAGRRDYEPKWIPVTERLPESGTRALVMRFDYVTNTPFYDLLWFDKGGGEWWNRHFTGDYAVTHWMSLPEPPMKEEPPKEK